MELCMAILHCSGVLIPSSDPLRLETWSDEVFFGRREQEQGAEARDDSNDLIAITR